MKTVIVAINAKYIHSSLAVWYLKASCGEQCGEVVVREFSINDHLDAILAAIYIEKADVVAFSCYIWNIQQVIRTAENIKKVLPHTTIILGGPEVSYDTIDFLQQHPFVDFMIRGEGERSFVLLLDVLKHSCKVDDPGIQGLTYRSGEEILTTEAGQLIEPLDSIPSPYTDEMLLAVGDRMIYYEASRGCPFHCTYCLSSIHQGVRYFSLERVKKDLNRLIDQGVRQVKFVDRTFNCNRDRTKALIEFMLQVESDINFHLEVAADLFDDALLELLKRAPLGRIQLEIGVQSTHHATLQAVDRKTNLNKLLENVQTLRKTQNIHLHMDLIAGLPNENFLSFKASFDTVYHVQPHMLQLGFLKLLKGTRIRSEGEQYGYIYRSYAPYEVLASKDIGYDEMLILKGIEEMVERYYNSGRFQYTLDYRMGQHATSPFDFYQSLYEFSKIKGFLSRPVSSRELYTLFLEYALKNHSEEEVKQIKALLKLDFLASDRSKNLPLGLERHMYSQFGDLCFQFLKRNENVERYLPHLLGMSAKQIFKLVHFEVFQNLQIMEGNDEPILKEEVLLFDYSQKNQITAHYPWHKLNFIF